MYIDTPVVKASGKVMSFVLIFGILRCFGMTFVLIMKPTNFVCGIQNFGVGFCFTVTYAALLTKTNRICRIFRAGKRTVKRPKFISPQSQVSISKRCSGGMMIQWFEGIPSHWTVWALMWMKPNAFCVNISMVRSMCLSCLWWSSISRQTRIPLTPHAQSNRYMDSTIFIPTHIHWTAEMSVL